MGDFMNETAKDIQNGFNALGGAVKESGKNRVKELVSKQGYVAYKNPEAVKAFQSDPEYADWKMVEVDGEYRFYPPENKKENDYDETLKRIMETYKKSKDSYNNTSATIRVDNGNATYLLSTIDKQTGKISVIESETVNFEGDFSMVVLPTIYAKMSSGLPLIDFEKDNLLSYTTPDTNHRMLFGGLSNEQVELVKRMAAFVDEQNKLTINNPQEQARKTM